MSKIKINTNQTTSTDGISVVPFGNNSYYVVAWPSKDRDGINNNIAAQFLYTNGTLLGSEFTVNTYTIGDQGRPSAASLTNGGFAIAWNSYNQYSSTSYHDIYAQCFDSNGNKVGAAFLVNTRTSDVQSLPSISSLSNSDFVITWQSKGQDAGSSDFGVYAQRFDVYGSKIGTEFLVNTYTSGDQSNPSIASLINGGFVIVWDSYTQEGSGGSGVYGQLFDSSATKQGSEFHVNTYLLGTQSNPSVANLLDKGFVVAWDSINYDGKDQDGYESGVYAQRFSLNGNKIGNEFKINDVRYMDQKDSSILALSDGGFVVAFKDDSVGGGAAGEYYGGGAIKFYDSNATKLGDSISIRVSSEYKDVLKISSIKDQLFVVWKNTPEAVGIFGEFYNITKASNPVDVLRSYNFITPLTDVLISETYGSNLFVKNLGNNKFLSGYTKGSDLPYGQLFDINGDKLGSEIVISKSWPVGFYSYGWNVRKHSIAVLSDGSYVFAWETTSNSHDIVYNVYDSNSNQITKGERANIRITAEQMNPSVIALDNGGFTIAWQSYGEVSSSSSTFDITSRTFDNSGYPVTGTPSFSTPYTDSIQANPSIAKLSNGNLVMAWWSSQASGYGVYARLFDANINSVGSAFKVNTYGNSSNTLQYPLALSLGDKFIITWESSGQDGNDYGIYGQLFNINGNKLSIEFLVNTYTTGFQGHHVTAKLNSGNFLVAWETYIMEASGSFRGEIRAQLFYSNATKAGSEIRINSYNNGYRENPSVDVLDNDNFIVSWNGEGLNKTRVVNGVFAKILDANLLISGNYNPDFSDQVSSSATSTASSTASSMPISSVGGTVSSTASSTSRPVVVSSSAVSTSSSTITATITPTLSATTANNFETTSTHTLAPTLLGQLSPSATSTTSSTAISSSGVTKSITPSVGVAASATSSATTSSSVTSTTTSTSSPQAFIVRYLTSGESYIGTSAKENFIVDSSASTTITGGGGDDRFTIKPSSNINITITDFDQHKEQIDLSSFSGIKSFNDFRVTQGSAIVNLPENQKVILQNLQPGDVSSDNFIYSSAGASSSGNQAVSSPNIPAIVGGVVGGVAVIGVIAGLIYCLMGKSAKIATAVVVATNAAVDTVTSFQGDAHNFMHSNPMNGQGDPHLPGDVPHHAHEV